jgi:hypothetical protein
LNNKTPPHCHIYTAIKFEQDWFQLSHFSVIYIFNESYVSIFVWV